MEADELISQNIGTLNPDWLFTEFILSKNENRDLNDGSSELNDYLQKNNVINEDNQEYLYWKGKFSRVSHKEELLDILKAFLIVRDYFEMAFPDNALHTHSVRKLSYEIWKASDLPHNQRVQTEVWQNWSAAVYQATKSTDNQ